LVIRLKRKNKRHTEENLIPLINIVFLILVFFLAAGMLRSFKEENIKPATANLSHNTERPVGPVLIGANGQITVHGIEYDQKTLLGILQGRVSLGITNPLPVIADKDLAADKLVEVIETAKMAGIKKIRLVMRRRAAP
jgi:biopolymer transport protein ExbD